MDEYGVCDVCGEYNYLFDGTKVIKRRGPKRFLVPLPYKKICQQCFWKKELEIFKRMRKMIAIFPGRFNPPHLGHIRTLLRLMDESKYNKIIVAVTLYDCEGKKPPAVSLDEVVSMLNSVLKYFPIFKIITYDGPFSKRTSFDDLPKFDIVVSGNKLVYDNAIKQGLKARFIERTLGYRGEFLRDAVREAYLKEMKNAEKD